MKFYLKIFPGRQEIFNIDHDSSQRVVSLKQPLNQINATTTDRSERFYFEKTLFRRKKSLADSSYPGVGKKFGLKLRRAFYDRLPVPVLTLVMHFEPGDPCGFVRSFVRARDSLPAEPTKNLTSLVERSINRSDEWPTRLSNKARGKAERSKARLDTRMEE